MYGHRGPRTHIINRLFDRSSGNEPHELRRWPFAAVKSLGQVIHVYDLFPEDPFRCSFLSCAFRSL